MNRQYVKPIVTEYSLSSEQLLGGSAVSSEIGITYGGVDESGIKDPLSRQLPDFDIIFTRGE